MWVLFPFKGNFGEVVNVRLAMDHVVSFMKPFICIALRPVIHALVLIFYPLYRLTFPKDLHMLSSRIGRRLKRPSYIWMVYDLFSFLNSGIVVLHKFCNPISIYVYLQAQIDGKVVRAKFTLPERKKVASPPKAVATTSRRDPAKPEDAAVDGDGDGGKRPKDGKTSL